MIPYYRWIKIYISAMATWLCVSHVSVCLCVYRVHIWHEKTIMAELQPGEGRTMIDSVVWAQYINVTHRQPRRHSKCRHTSGKGERRLQLFTLSVVEGALMHWRVGQKLSVSLADTDFTKPCSKSPSLSASHATQRSERFAVSVTLWHKFRERKVEFSAAFHVAVITKKPPLSVATWYLQDSRS